MNRRVAVIYYGATGNVRNPPPTRRGARAQLKQFIDQAGRLWQEGKLADKVATMFTS
jgi:hypothetical protein